MPTSEIFIHLFSFFFGTVIGSFLNVCIYRVPREKSIVYPGSHCTSCDQPISFYYNIPILSYVLLGGKCQKCNSSISGRYPLVELITGLLFFVTVWKFGLGIETLFYLLLISALIAITFIDLEHKIIPNVITYPGILMGILYSALITDWDNFRQAIHTFNETQNLFSTLRELPVLDSIFGIILGGGILLLIAYLYKALKKRDGMGMGDVKLLAMIGAFFGWEGVLFVIFLGSILGSVIGISIIIAKKGDLKYALPFGSFLSIAAVVYIFTGGFKVFVN